MKKNLGELENTITVEVESEVPFMKKHAKKIILGSAAVAVIGTVILLRKTKAVILKRDRVITDIIKVNETLTNAASEGLFDVAFTSIMDKIKSRKSKLEELKAIENPNDIDKHMIKRITGELSELENRLDKIMRLQELVQIIDVDE